MSVDRFREFLGIGPASLAGKEALGSVAETLQPGTTNRRQLVPIEGSLPSPFDFGFKAEGEGYFVDRHGTIYPDFRRPSVTIIHPSGREDTYQAGRLTGIVRRSSDKFPNRPLTLQDAAILEAAARETIVLKTRRDYQTEQALLRNEVLRIAPSLHQAIANRVPSSGFDTGWHTHAHKVFETLTNPLFNLSADNPYAVLSYGLEHEVDPNTHAFSVVRKIDPLSAEAYGFRVEKIGQRGNDIGRLEVTKTSLLLSGGVFADLSKKELVGMITSGSSSSFVPTDTEFLEGVSRWIKNPINPDNLGVEFSQGPWTSVAYRKSPSEIITATISGDTQRTGTKFTTSEDRPGEQSSIDRPSSLSEISALLGALAKAGPSLEINPWFSSEAAQTRALLSGSRITIRQILTKRIKAGTPAAEDSGLNQVVLEGILEWLDKQVTNLTAMHLLQTL